MKLFALNIFSHDNNAKFFKIKHETLVTYDLYEVNGFSKFGFYTRGKFKISCSK